MQMSGSWRETDAISSSLADAAYSNLRHHPHSPFRPALIGSRHGRKRRAPKITGNSAVCTATPLTSSNTAPLWSPPGPTQASPSCSQACQRSRRRASSAWAVRRSHRVRAAPSGASGGLRRPSRASRDARLPEWKFGAEAAEACRERGPCLQFFTSRT